MFILLKNELGMYSESQNEYYLMVIKKETMKKNVRQNSQLLENVTFRASFYNFIKKIVKKIIW